MKAWKISGLCILLTFLCVFTSIGYAKMSDDLSVTGSAKISIPYGLFIIDIRSSDEKNLANDHQYSFMEYTTTVDSALRRTSGTGSVTYTITVLNNTNLTYSYRKIYYQTTLEGYNGNSYVSTTENRSKLGVVCSLDTATAEQKKVRPGETLTFTVKYTVGSSMKNNTLWKTLINFQFGINVDGEREAIEVVEKKFLDILNTPSTYNQLIDALDNKFDGYQEWTSNYIGNVTGSSSEDSVAVNTLFLGQLQITVGKDQMDATVLIKHENLDWNNYTGDDYTAVNSSNGGVFNGYGCEMTLYLTIDPLTSAGSYVPVYAVVFTCDRDWEGNKTSEWYRIGSTYAGEANVVTYDGGNGTGSFVTDNWRADAATYQIIEGYSYNIKGEVYRLNAYSHRVDEYASIKTIVSAKDTNAVNTLQTLLNDAKRIIDNHTYAGMGIELIQETYDKLSDIYTVDANGNHIVDSELTIAQLSPAIVNLYSDVNQALIRIDALNKEAQN